jgi:hypothetical protein
VLFTLLQASVGSSALLPFNRPPVAQIKALEDDRTKLFSCSGAAAAAAAAAAAGGLSCRNELSNSVGSSNARQIFHVMVVSAHIIR